MPGRAGTPVPGVHGSQSVCVYRGGTMEPQATRPASANAPAGSTRPSAFSHLLHDRGARFAAGLAIVVAIPVAVLFYFQFHSLTALEETSAVVLRQLSGDTAESLTGDIEEA